MLAWRRRCIAQGTHASPLTRLRPISWYASRLSQPWGERTASAEPCRAVAAGHGQAGGHSMSGGWLTVFAHSIAPCLPLGCCVR